MKGKPSIASRDQDRCQARTIETQWKREKGTDLRCPFFARLLVGKKHLCSRHAMMEALAICVNEGRAQIIQIPQTRTPYQAVPVIEK